MLEEVKLHDVTLPPVIALTSFCFGNYE